MLTDQDIKKLLKVLATKQDLENYFTKEEITNFFTSKDELKYELQKYATKEELGEFKNGTYDRLDKVIGELKTIREEQAAHSQEHEDINEILSKIKSGSMVAHSIKK
ncbi:hypothetical protein HYS91_01320 [Candidatus Daviesbacteria bacterium]|nr:hypothetical protein [Candidatus Daviesbacteria bacterium]